MNVKILVAAIIIFLVTLSAAVYGMDFGKAESVSFTVAVPAGTITAPTLVKGTGPQVSMAPLTINLAGRGFPKMLFNGGIERIKSSTITNVGKKPVRIRMEMINGTIPVQWNVKAGVPYDPESHTFTEPLMPGKSIPNFGGSWYFSFPPEKLHDPVVYDGGLKFSDADTGETLTFLPIRFVNGNPSAEGKPESEEGACH
ncbi:MAG: hypothetical protein PHF57_08585 [Methanoregula sp.]|jgi:hypothetical protein|nr:hypothetical protein [Methanoregula sp.]